MNHSELADCVHTEIQKKMDALNSVQKILDWRFHLGATQGDPASVEHDDGTWETVQLMKTWSSADGEAWFRTSVNIPESSEGISLQNSRLDLEVFLAIGATVYVNGVERFKEDFWTDSRAVLLTLDERYVPGQPLTIAVRCNAGDGFGLFLMAQLRISVITDAIFQLDLVRSQTNFTHFLIQGGGARDGGESTRPTAGGPVQPIERNAAGGDHPELEQAWLDATKSLDLDALTANHWADWYTSVGTMRQYLEPFRHWSKEYEAHLVAHSHIDMNWLWPWHETVEVCRRDFTAVDWLMTKYPEFHFSQSMASTYAAMETQQPELFERIRARIAEGRWDVTASTWVEGDLNMAAGETLVRQILHTRKYIKEHFGVEPLICWEPDTFGHTANYPQILAKSGIKYYYFCRAGKRHPLFWWEGMDGSRVLAVQDPRGYGGENNPSDVVGSVIDFAGRYGIHHGLYVYGAGDHGGGATAHDIDMARQIDSTPFVPHARPASSVAFYKQALAEGPELPVVTGELNTVFEGCYTSHGDIKRMNRDGENLLLSAETILSTASQITGSAYPLNQLAEAWRVVCFHQFHDILCGCAIGVTYREARENLSSMSQSIRTLVSTALQDIAHIVDTGNEVGTRIAVFNPLAWLRNDIVKIPLDQITGSIPEYLEDEDGNVTATQVSGNELLFVARIPSLTMRVYKPSQCEIGSALRVDSNKLSVENGILSLRIHPSSGAIDSLVDLENSRDIAGPWAGWGPEAKLNSGMLNRLQLVWEQPHPMSAWNIGDTTRVDHLISGAAVRALEHGPVRCVIEVSRKVEHSTVTQRVVVYNLLRRIDFETEVDWHERGGAHVDAPMLRTTFTPSLGKTTATYEVAYAGIERPADGREVPALRWADISEEDYGIALLNNCKYGYHAQGNTLGLTLVRASYEPDTNPDEGRHEFTYSLYPHAGDWRKANIAQRGAELNQPLQAIVTDIHAGQFSKLMPFVTCDNDGVIVSAVKLAEDQLGNTPVIVVRAYEVHGQPACARLSFNKHWSKLREADLMEHGLCDVELRDNAVELKFAPYEIKTLLLYS